MWDHHPSVGNLSEGLERGRWSRRSSELPRALARAPTRAHPTRCTPTAWAGLCRVCTPCAQWLERREFRDSCVVSCSSAPWRARTSERACGVICCLQLDLVVALERPSLCGLLSVDPSSGSYRGLDGCVSVCGERAVPVRALATGRSNRPTLCSVRRAT